MSTSLVLVALALLGAALFLSAGYSLGRALVAAPIEVPPPPPVPTADDEARARAQSLERTVAQLHDELGSERVTRQQLAQRLESSTTDLADSRNATRALEEKLAALGATHASLVERQSSLQTELEQARRVIASKPPPGFNEHELARTHEALERACEEIVTLRLEKQRGERAELARLALERELSHLRATQVAAATSSRPLRTVAVPEPDLTTTHLNALVERVRVDGEYLAVAVADAQGLAAAGVGERVDELAAFSALVLQLHAQASRYFPMHGFGHTTLSDAQGVTVEARLVPGPHGLVLLTLGATQEWR